MPETVSAALVEGRKGDGYLVVVQDNAARALTILSVNEVAQAQLGYPEDDLKGRKLEVILGPRTAEVIEEDLEYDDGAPDMADILARQRELRLRTRSGQELAVPTTIHRMMAEDRNARFQLILPNEREGRARDQWRQFIKTSLEGHTQIDPATGLPNRATAEAHLRSVGHYLAESGMQASFAVLRLDRYQKSLARYGLTGVQYLLQHVGNCCRSTFRGEDTIYALSEDRLGLLLIDISRESVRVVLNRLRWNIRTHTIEFGGKSDFSNTVSIAFDMLKPEESEQLLMRCEAAVAELDADSRNALIERGH